jgi:hypothetical protein
LKLFSFFVFGTDEKETDGGTAKEGRWISDHVTVVPGGNPGCKPGILH